MSCCCLHGGWCCELRKKNCSVRFICLFVYLHLSIPAAVLCCSKAHRCSNARCYRLLWVVRGGKRGRGLARGISQWQVGFKGYEGSDWWREKDFSLFRSWRNLNTIPVCTWFVSFFFFFFLFFAPLFFQFFFVSYLSISWILHVFVVEFRVPFHLHRQIRCSVCKIP